MPSTVLVISAQSLEYIHVPFTANVDPDTVTAEIALTPSREGPEEADWRAATIQTGTARVLVGPGELELGPGIHYVWVRITDNPEIPVERVGALNVIG